LPFALIWVGLLKIGWGAGAVILGANIYGFGKGVWRQMAQFGTTVVVGNKGDVVRAACEELRRQGVRVHEILIKPEEETPQEFSEADQDILAGAAAIVIACPRASAERLGVHGDLLVARIVDALKTHFVDKLGREAPPRIVAQCLDASSRPMLHSLGCDAVLSESHFHGEMLGQVATKSGLGAVLEQLITTSDQDAEFYFHPLTASDVATFGTFGGLARYIDERGAIAVGLATTEGDTEDSVLLNPSRDRALRTSDRIIVIAEDEQWPPRVQHPS
jgi:hypothetical protein